MQTSSSPTAVVQVESHRPSLLTFEIRAKIAREDMQWMARRVDAALDAREQIDLLLLKANNDSAELGAVFDGEAAGVMMRSLKHVRRYWVVGAPGWARAMIELFKRTTPVEEMTFTLDERPEARRRIDAL
jgi:hypothetical protein